MGSKQIFEVISSIKGVDLNLESEFISVSSVSLLEVAEKFKNDTTLDFDFLMCITALDDGNSKSFTVAYNFHSNKNNHSIEVRVSITEGEDVPSLSGIWKTADWYEREAYDMIEMLYLTEGGMLELGEICTRWGVEPKKIEALGLNVLGSIGGYTAGNE